MLMDIFVVCLYFSGFIAIAVLIVVLLTRAFIRMSGHTLSPMQLRSTMYVTRYSLALVIIFGSDCSASRAV